MGKSSKDKRDIFYRLAKEKGYRARSSFKLIQINESTNILNCKRVVDLCAAPGSWSQVLVEQCINCEIVGVDLQEIAPIPGVTFVRGDITKESTLLEIKNCFKESDTWTHGMIDLVICDGAPDVTGMHDMDEYIQSELLISALNISIKLLVPGGTFLGKIFRGRDVSLMVAQMRVYFGSVVIVKPAASRDSSIEAFILCRDFKGLESLQIDPLLNMRDINLNESTSSGSGRELNYDESINQHVTDTWFDVRGKPGATARFIACGDLNGLDADFSYSLDPGYVSLDPIQAPIDPPYKSFMESRQKK